MVNYSALTRLLLGKRSFFPPLQAQWLMKHLVWTALTSAVLCRALRDVLDAKISSCFNTNLPLIRAYCYARQECFPAFCVEVWGRLNSSLATEWTLLITPFMQCNPGNPSFSKYLSLDQGCITVAISSAACRHLNPINMMHERRCSLDLTVSNERER